MIIVWVLFLALIALLLTLDLGVFHKKAHVVSMKESLLWTSVWVFIAFLFGGVIYWVYKDNLFGFNPNGILPGEALLKYYTGYIIEESLSLDNIFVIAMIFTYFKIPAKAQHGILFWGIIGAVFFRGIMIFLGTAIIQNFLWSTYIFGAILLYSAFSMMTTRHDNVDYYKNPALRLLNKIIPIDWEDKSHKYFIVKDGKRYATMLFATLIVVEFTDVLFAVDSIPAIFAVTTDPFLVFSSNIFAILGLRNLYFFLASMMDRFGYIKYSLVFILIFVGMKMILVNHYHFPSYVSLVIIIGSLVTGILASVFITPKKGERLKSPLKQSKHED